MPSGIGQSLRGWQNRELRRSKLVELVLSNDIGRQMIVISQRSDGLPLGFQLQFCHRGELRCLGGHDGDRGLLRTLEMFPKRSGKRRVSTHDGRFWFFGAISSNRPDRRLVTFG